MPRALLGGLSLLALTLLATLAPAKRARACGELFYSQQSPTPVDQNAERILFCIHEDGSVTAVVEIS